MAGAFLQQQVPTDTTKKDTTEVYKPTKTGSFDPEFRFGDPFSSRSSSSPFNLKDPSELDLEITYDSGFNYTIYERIGNTNFRAPTQLSFREYDRFNDERLIEDYWKEQSAGLDGESAVSGRRLIPKLYISPVFDRIFGGSYIDIQPTGFVNLDFGGLFQFIDNPQVPERQRRNGGFNFNMQISSNVVGKVGDKLAVTLNFDNNNTFDFQNDMKVEYTGYEEDIIKSIEIGNVSMPVNNSLMTGGQSLFGIKTQLQFGKLFVTGIASRQRGRNDVITIENGVDRREFEIRASNYDENRHFFIGHFFRNNYGIEPGNWLSNLPQIQSGINITRMEVYVMNRNNNTETTRNFLAFMDLGEGRRVFNPSVGGRSNNPTNNGSNDLFDRLQSIPGLRNPDEANSILENQFGMIEGTDFVKITTARRLEDTEYRINPQLGYISLLRKLQNDEVLAVAFEYTYNGRVYKVGELTEDYQGRSDEELIYLKMLRPNKINTEVPTWDLMMKNIYNLNSGQIQQEGFELRVHYRDDRTGQDNPSIHEGSLTKDVPLLRLVGLDNLNPNNDRQEDGNFDFIEGVTIDTRNGNIIFPVLEPFGATLESNFLDSEARLKRKYVYDTLYQTTKADAELVADLNKYFIKGSFSGGSGSEIVLPGINVAPNSVVVTAGNTPLTEGLDYTVDYNLGRVRILNEGILNSGKTIQIAYEKADLFNFQTRWLTGARFDYKISEKFNIGATVLHLNERPGGITRFAVGDEPTRNTKYGFDINYREESRFLTKLVDFLPLVNTKEMSSVAFSGEFAQILPGTSNIVEGEGTSYLDDFENAITPIRIDGWPSWRLASVPEPPGANFDQSEQFGPLGVNHRRAKLAWYTVDNSVFYTAGGNRRPDNITEDDLENHYVKPVLPQDIFQQQDRNLVVINEPLFDIAYFPQERGPYNFNPNLDVNGLLPNPEQNWAGITRPITNEVDFDKTNVEYLEFWMLDPFIGADDSNPRGVVRDGIFNENNSTGGEIIFNLGSVSEDVIPDGKHAFENGLPADGNYEENADRNAFGYVTRQQYLTNFFENAGGIRENQDVGLDGLRNDLEAGFHTDYIESLNLTSQALDPILDDPAGDNFRYYLDPTLDAANAKILQRYKNFNGLDGNSPVNTGGLTQASTVNPDNEDLNQDNTIQTLEEYYEYKLRLRPGDLEVGRNNIVDKTVDGSGEATWYLFRIPIRNPDRVVGGINGFKTIRYIRMYLTRFQQPVVLRMAKMQLVGSQWRQYREPLNEIGLNEVPEISESDFTISVVNIEENSQGDEFTNPYRVPPGLNRDRDNTTILNRRVNEQSLQICVDDLEDKDARAVYKNVSYDLINYGRIKMFFHAEANNQDIVNDDEVAAFLRFGTDFTENYYEIEVPLKITPKNVPTADEEALRRALWPLENEIDISINELLGLKSERNRQNLDVQIPYSTESNNGRYKITVKGRPDMSTILTMMIGARNPEIENDDRSPKSICLWANELRVTDFDTNKGWAANARVSTKLADLATITASTRYVSTGFGTIQQRISERTREETFQYDISANVNVDKFLLPEKTGLKVPMFVSYENTRITPQFDPLDPDVPLEASIESFDSQEARDSYRRLVEDRTTRRSLNFTNVRKTKVKEDAKSHIYDIENLALSYAFSEQRTSNINTETLLRKQQTAGIAYNYSPGTISIEPFANVGFLDNKYLQLIKDINFSPLPNTLSARAELARNFTVTQLYNDELTTEGVDPFYERLFTFNRNYNLRWSIFKSLTLDYTARANAVIDEPDGVIEGDINTTSERDYIMDRILSLGRMKNYQQDISANYRLPLDKLPLTDWLSADYRISVGYNWIAGSLNQEDSLGNFFGHTIQNKRDQTYTGKVDLVGLYNKIGFLKDVNTPQRRGGRSRNQSEPEESPTMGPGIKTILRLLMSLRSINFSYTVRESTGLPGFTPEPYMFGMDTNWMSPGWSFILGDQNPDFRFRAAENGWLTESPLLSTPFQQTFDTDLSIRANVEPFPDLKIQLEANRTNRASFQELFRRDSAGIDYVSQTPNRSGSYNISFMSIQTAFERQSGNESPAFRQFIDNIDVINSRLTSANSANGEYGSNSQDVLLPAFLAAYSGQNANETRLKPFPEIPIPNWRLDYAGLSKLPGIQDIFSSVNITHSYRSAFSINNYTNSLQYTTNLDLNNNILDYPTATIVNDSAEFVPVYIINQATIIEQFAPLIGINVRTKNNLQARLDFKQDRNLSLNLSNSQVTETTNNDVSFDLGWTKTDLKLPFKIKGRTISINNDVTFRMNFSIRDQKTVQRKLNGENTVTNGNRNFQMRPSIGYQLNNQLDITAYFERSMTQPRVGSFDRASTAFGAQLRFNLAQ